MIFLDKEKSYEEKPADIVIQALMIASNERLSDFEINFYTQEIIKINSFYAQIITTNNAEDDGINIDIKRWKRTNLIPDVLILVEIDYEENSILFKGILTSEELFNLFQKNQIHQILQKT